MRIHLAAPGGGAACGAHNVSGCGRGFAGGSHQRASESTVLASPILALVDCRKCRRTTQYQTILNPSRQYQLRLFAMVKNTDPPRRATPADIGVNMTYHSVAVFLNGRAQPSVIAYDADEGWVERHVLDARGRYVIKGATLATERVAGDVKVQWKQAA